MFVALVFAGKLALVVRKEGDGLRSYAHIGTGNYHVKTARLYTDFGLFTCDPVLTRDVVNLFLTTGRAREGLQLFDRMRKQRRRYIFL